MARPRSGTDAADIASAVTAHPRGAVLNLIVTPRSGVTALAGVEGAALRVRVAAPPVDGAANAVLIRFLAEQLGVPKSSVRVLTGATGRRKRVLIEGEVPEAVASALQRTGGG